MIEEMEIKMRNLLQEVCWPFLVPSKVNDNGLCSQVYFGKTRDIVYDLRSVDDLEKARRQRDLQKELVGFIKR